MPELFVITGPNGAGKSSNAKSLLPDLIDLPVFDGDKLFYQLLENCYKEVKVTKYAREKAGHELEQIFQRDIQSAIDSNSDYAFEGHFSNENSWQLLNHFRNNGYKINMIFLALESVQMSLQRVAVRVSQGGHHVPPISIHENFSGNIRMLDQHLGIIDNLKIIDNSGYKSIHLVTLEHQQPLHLANGKLPPWIKENMPNLFKLLSIN